MVNYHKINGYEQSVSDNEITCTCMWTTMEMSRYPKNPEKRKDCKHIKQIREMEGKWRNEIIKSKKEKRKDAIKKNP